MQKNNFDQLKDKLQIMDYINKDGLDKEFLDKYDKLESSLSKLLDTTEDYFIYSLDGDIKKVDKDNQDKLLEAYQEVANATEYFKQFYDGEDIKTVFSTITKSIDELISSDIKAIAKVTTPDTLENVIANGRKKVIDITGQQVKNVGANMSSRQIINVSDNKKAVFTKESKYDPTNQLQDNLNAFNEKYPMYSQVFDFLYQKENLNKLAYLSIPYDKTKKTFDMDLNTTIKNSLPKLYNNIMANEHIKIVYNNLSGEKGFNEIMYNFFEQTCKTVTNYNINSKILKVGMDENIDDRNSAMSIIAGLLGVEDLLAHSEPVTIVNNGEKVNGTLMNFAEGKDIFNLDVDDSMRNASLKNEFVTKEVKKQVSNLQILDFICGNIDRHSGNMFYQFDETNPKKPIFKGIVGIDNDASFAILDDKKCKEGFSNMIGLDKMFLIDETMAQKIAGLTPAMLKVSLKGLKMSDMAIEGACKRLGMVQEKLANALVFGKDAFDTTKINIMNDKAWEEATFLGMAKAVDNTYYNRIKGSINFVKDVNYMKGDVGRDMMAVKIKLMQEINPLEDQLEDSNKSIASGIKKFRGSSKQYNQIQTLGLELRELSKSLQFDSSDEKIKGFMTKLSESKEKVQAYLDRKYEEAHPSNPKKKGKVFGNYTQHRIEVMKAYLKKLQAKENNLQKVLEKKAELEAIDLSVDKKLVEQENLKKSLNKNAEIDKVSEKVVNNEVNKEVNKKVEEPSKNGK